MSKTRYWVKIDSKGKPVLGVMQSRPKRPKNGEWLEINARPCCTSSTPIGTPANDATLSIYCGSVDPTNLLGEFVVATVTSADDVVAGFNSTYPKAGTLSHDGTNFYLKSTLCPSMAIEIAYA